MNIVNSCHVVLVDSMGSDLRVADAARVSMNKISHLVDGELQAKDAKLIGYLADHDHWTPFGHVIVTLRIAMPVFIARQWFRHTVGAVRNEVRRRYVEDMPAFFLPDVIRVRPDGSIKQGSGGEHPKSKYLRQQIQDAYHRAEGVYERLIEDGVAPEQARIVLPVAHITEFYETASLAFYGRCAGLRLDAHAQGEIQDFMKLVQTAVEPVAPAAWKSLTKAHQ